MIIADQSHQGIFDGDCLKLADLHSDAVDYPKSGQPVSLNKIPKLKFRAKPDWNAPETVTSDSDKFYESKMAIGKLFRSIDLPDLRTVKDMTRTRSQKKQPKEGHEVSLEEVLAAFHLDDTNREEDVMRTAVEDRVQLFIDTRPLDEDTINYASQLFNRYASELRTLCATHTLTYSRSSMLTEEEAMVGTIVAKCSQPRKRKDLMAKLREQTNLLVTAIREDLMGDEDLPLEDALMRAWVAWELSAVEKNVFGAKSFGWVALGGIFEVIKDIEERDKQEGSRF
jgi:RNA-dependent RNA polymerase